MHMKTSNDTLLFSKIHRCETRKICSHSIVKTTFTRVLLNTDYRLPKAKQMYAYSICFNQNYITLLMQRAILNQCLHWINRFNACIENYVLYQDCTCLYCVKVFAKHIRPTYVINGCLFFLIARSPQQTQRT